MMQCVLKVLGKFKTPFKTTREIKLIFIITRLKEIIKFAKGSRLCISINSRFRPGELHKPSQNKKDEPFTEVVDQYHALEVTARNILLVLCELRKKQSKYFAGVQNIAGDCVSVQFLKHTEKETSSVTEEDFDDCSCRHIKAVIKDGQFTMNTRWQFLIEERYLLMNLSEQCFICCQLDFLQKLLPIKMCISQN